MGLRGVVVHHGHPVGSAPSLVHPAWLVLFGIQGLLILLHTTAEDGCVAHYCHRRKVTL